jgi:hypothetical protein
MLDPGASLAIASIALEVLDRILGIINEARQLTPECEELGSIATVLKIVLRKNHDALDTYESWTQLQACLTDVEVFVVQCTGTLRWRLLKRAREVLFDHKLPQLRQRLLRWVSVFTLEGTVSIMHPPCSTISS